MNRITNAFKGKKTLIAFITGGDPDPATTEKLIPAMAEAGADLIEIGIPFSDPVAEGPVIQKAHERALANGCTVDGLFDAVKRARAKTDIPLLFMTYANPVYRCGVPRFMSRCEECGIDGLIVPDVPFEEKEEMESDAMRHGVSMISMIAPTSGDRIDFIAKEAQGFLYCVSSLGVTGVRNQIGAEIGEMTARVRKVSSIPCAVGFGISTPEQARSLSALADGVIVGSAIVDLMDRHGKDCVGPVTRLVKELKSAV